MFHLLFLNNNTILKLSDYGRRQGGKKMGTSYRVEQSADDFVQMFKEIYEPIQNIERDFYRIYARMIESMAACMQYLNRGDDLHIATELPTVFSWFCSLVFKCQMEHQFVLDDIIWEKYPYICPYCLKSTCTCRGKIRDLSFDALIDFQENNKRKRPKTLSEWQKMFALVYPRNPQGYSLASNFNHLYEEMGEISEAYRFRYNAYKNLENEIVDAFSWILGAANFLDAKAQINALPSYSEYDLATEVFKKYNGKCSKCGHSPCTCKLFIPKISEYNQVLTWEDMSAQLAQGIEEIKAMLDKQTEDVLRTEEATQLIKEILEEVQKNKETAVTKEDVESIYSEYKNNPKHKKWYKNISMSGIAESSIVSALFMLIELLFKGG